MSEETCLTLNGSQPVRSGQSALPTAQDERCHSNERREEDAAKPEALCGVCNLQQVFSRLQEFLHIYAMCLVRTDALALCAAERRAERTRGLRLRHLGACDPAKPSGERREESSKQCATARNDGLGQRLTIGETKAPVWFSFTAAGAKKNECSMTWPAISPEAFTRGILLSCKENCNVHD